MINSTTGTSPKTRRTAFHNEQDDYNTKLIASATTGSKPLLGLYRDSEGKIVEVIAVNVSVFDVRMRVSRTNVLVCRDRLLSTKAYSTIPIMQFLAILPNNKKRYTKIKEEEEFGNA